MKTAIRGHGRMVVDRRSVDAKAKGRYPGQRLLDQGSASGRISGSAAFHLRVRVWGISLWAGRSFQS